MTETPGNDTPLRNMHPQWLGSARECWPQDGRAATLRACDGGTLSFNADAWQTFITSLK